MSILKYDVDCSTWSPQGKILQVDYAKEAVKQGSICLAIRSSEGAVLLSIKKNPSKLATYQEKIFKVSKRVGVGISGMTGDARKLVQFMNAKSVKAELKKKKPASSSSLSNKLMKKMHDRTVTYGKRPYGVGLLVIGEIDDGFGVFELTPAGEKIEYEAFAIGAKSQSAKTYLEKHLPTFKKAEVEKLVLHGLSAIKAGYRDEPEDMSEKNVEVATVSKNADFRIWNKEEIKNFLARQKDFKPEAEMIIE